jgi:hypothetical protein
MTTAIRHIVATRHFTTALAMIYLVKGFLFQKCEQGHRVLGLASDVEALGL